MLSNVEQLFERIFENISDEDRDATLCRLKVVHPEADAAREGFEGQMRGVGALSETAKVSPLFADATVSGIQSMLCKALQADQSALEAEGMIRSVMDAASCNSGAWPDGSPVLFEASLDGALDLYEVNGDPV